MLKLTASSIILDVPRSAVQEAKELAEASAAKYQQLVDLKKAPYHQNTVHSHFIGKIGEIGAAMAFEQLKSLARAEITVDEVFRDSKRDRECDIIINDLRVEVKCWKPYALDLYGPCVSDRQAVKLAKKADAVVYCTFDERSGQFILHGWNTMKDIEETPAQLTGPAGKPEKQVLNRKMAMRLMSELPILSHQVA